MKEKELLNLGFKKITEGNAYWFELKKGRHRFITNDTYYSKKDFFVAYDIVKAYDQFWFNNKLKTVEDFKVVYRILTGKSL